MDGEEAPYLVWTRFSMYLARHDKDKEMDPENSTIRWKTLPSRSLYHLTTYLFLWHYDTDRKQDLQTDSNTHN